jgi:hypothetical protein
MTDDNSTAHYGLQEFAPKPKGGEEHLDPGEQARQMVFRRKGHRLGMFVLALSFVLVALGIGWPPFAFAGVAGLIFGYPLCRLWYWFRSV